MSWRRRSNWLEPERHAANRDVPILYAHGEFDPMIGIERFAFYDMARDSYAVIRTGERRFYGCFMFRKGVIPPDAALDSAPTRSARPRARRARDGRSRRTKQLA